MIGSTNDVIINYLKKYDMLSNSLNVISDESQRENIYFELNKLKKELINKTNEIYENDYYDIFNQNTTSIDEEKNRLLSLMKIINERKQYLIKMKNEHKMITGISIEFPDFVGLDMLDEYNNAIEIIDRYKENVQKIENLSSNLESVNDKYELAIEKINISNSLNDELELKLKSFFDDNFERLNCYKLKEEAEEIKKFYNELKYILEIANENMKITNTLSYSVDFDEQNQYEEIEESYSNYYEKMVILELMDIYDLKTKDYNELISKRKKINEILCKIPTSELYISVIGFVRDQFETIVSQEEDINTLKTLEEEKEKIENMILAIKEENNSEIFQSILKKIVQNEEEEREKKLIEIRKAEEQEKARIQEEEEERQEEIKKRQKLIEEERKKDMEERAKKILEEKQKNTQYSVLKADKKEDEINNEDAIFSEFEKNDDVSSKESTIDNLIPNEKMLNVLPDDLDEYMKNFDINQAEDDIFKEDQIFADY